MGIFNDNSQNDHYGHFKVVERGPPGPAGTGFELTDKGNYDIDGKRLTDVAEPVDGKDATTKAYVEKEIPHHPTTHYNLKKSFDFYDDNGVKIDLITDKINGLLSDYNYGYFKIPKSGDDVTFSFCKLLVRNDIEKSTYSALFYFYGFENDTLITGQDLGPILFDVRGVNCNILKYYDDDDSVHTQDHVKGVVWFTNTETNFGFEINLRFFDKSITHFVVLSRCVEGKVNLSFSLNIFNVAHNASLTYFFEDINMNGRKIKVVGSPVDVEDVANKNYVDGEIANIDTTPLLPRNGSRSMFGDLDMDGNNILSVENLVDYKDVDPYEYRVKDLKSVVNKEYLNENFLKKVDKDGIEYYDLKQIVIKNSAPPDDGSYDNDTLVSKAFVDAEISKLPKPDTDVLKLDGSKAMTGNLDMGGNIIKNIKHFVEDDSSQEASDAQRNQVIDFGYFKDERGELKRIINSVSSEALNRKNPDPMENNIDMANHSIINIKEPEDHQATYAANVKFVNDTIEKKIQESEERSIQSAQQENVFEKVMTDNLFKEDDDRIEFLSTINYNLLHRINHLTYLFRIKKDPPESYNGRLSIDLRYLPTGTYTMVFEMKFFPQIDHDEVSVNAISSSLNQVSTKTRVIKFDYGHYSRSIINFNKSFTNPGIDDLDIDLHLSLKDTVSPKPDKTSINVIVYGVKGTHSDIPIQTWDKLYDINNGTLEFEIPINMNEKAITNLKDPVNDQDAVTKKYVKSVSDSHINSSDKTNAFQYVMNKPNDHLIEEDDIKFGNLVTFQSSPHSINKKAIDTKLLFDAGHGYYSSRASINLYVLPNGSYTMAFELIWSSDDVDHDTVSLNGISAVETIHDLSNKTFNNYSRLIMQFSTSTDTAPNHLYVDIVIKMKSGKSYPNELQTYMVCYGIKGLQSDVPSNVYDALWSVNNSKVTFNETIDMGNNKITGVADGTDNNDAVNKSQLDAIININNYFTYTNKLKHNNDTNVRFPRINRSLKNWKPSISFPFDINLYDDRTFKLRLDGWYHIIYTDNIRYGANFKIHDVTNNVDLFSTNMSYKTVNSHFTINAIFEIAIDKNIKDHIEIKLQVERLVSSYNKPILEGSSLSTFYIKYLGP